ncbi:MAG: TraB/VirB10 family protein [Planctomycetota bacterium]|jgi:hypothetical protein
MKNKKLLVLGLAAGALILLLFLASQEGRPARAPDPPPRAPDFDVGIPTAQEVRSLVQGYGVRVEETEAEVRNLQSELAALRAEMAKGSEARLRMLQVLQQELGNDAPPPQEEELPRFRKFTFGTDAARQPSLHIPAGSFGEATLLTGVFAPVNDEALPVLLRLDAALVGPAHSRVPVRGAFLVGKAQGDANSQRAVIQLQTLSYVADDGRTIEVPVNGWVIDDDGIQGLRGTYVWRAGELTAQASVSSGLAAGADALSAGETTTGASPLGTTTGVTGNVLRFAGSRAASGALGKISEIIARRMEEIVPAVYVANGKPVTVALISGATLTDMNLEDRPDEPSRNPFSGLDAHR